MAAWQGIKASDKLFKSDKRPATAQPTATNPPSRQKSGKQQPPAGTPPITEFYPPTVKKPTSSSEDSVQYKEEKSHSYESDNLDNSETTNLSDYEDDSMMMYTDQGNYQQGDDKNKFPLMINSEFYLRGKGHLYLYDIKEFRRSGRFIPYPTDLDRKMERDAVVMPYSCYMNYDPNNKETLPKRLSDIIEQALGTMPIRDSYELQDAILAYNEDLRDSYFDGLHTYFRKIGNSESKRFFKQTLPKMISLALRLPKLITKPIPFLKKGRFGSVTMSQEQAACLLANGFFCTFPERNNSFGKSRDFGYPAFNFNSLFEITSDRVLQKLKCIIHYFERVTNEMPAGTITYERRKVFNRDGDLERSKSKFCEFHAESGGVIEDAMGMSQIDFANKRIGGGVLRAGCVQEEIRFVLSPELLVSLLITQILGSDECLIIRGSLINVQNDLVIILDIPIRSSGLEAVWIRRRDGQGQLYSEVVAIDALVFQSFSEQLMPQYLTREILKAYCGFRLPPSYKGDRYAIATGNWGCGAFGGDKLLKGLIQMMAAAEAARPLCYFTFGDEELVDKLVQLNRFLRENGITVGSMMQGLLKYAQLSIKHSSDDLLRFILSSRSVPAKAE